MSPSIVTCPTIVMFVLGSSGQSFHPVCSMSASDDQVMGPCGTIPCKLYGSSPLPEKLTPLTVKTSKPASVLKSTISIAGEIGLRSSNVHLVPGPYFAVPVYPGLVMHPEKSALHGPELTFQKGGGTCAESCGFSDSVSIELLLDCRTSSESDINSSVADGSIARPFCNSDEVADSANPMLPAALASSAWHRFSNSPAALQNALTTRSKTQSTYR